MRVNRWREWQWLLVPVVLVVMFTWPIWWLFRLPTDLRFVRIQNRATDDVDVDLTFVRAIHWFTRGVEWCDEDHYFELDFVHGKLVVKDTYEGRLRRRLEVLGLLPAPISLGSEHSGYEIFAWMASMLVALVLAFVCC